ncbi:alpha/beta fold hydrolase [Nocardioides sp. LHG3406-4]|uniref:alpha/beta fold hydrolase n=1 Tax=Nocardioides sp. LHG3406-4 TaxID=2804575 RepID=UPI003CFBAA58
MGSGPAQAPADHRLDHDGFSTFFLETGAGPTVVLIHGSGPGVSGVVNWGGTLASGLRHSFRLIAPDIIGFGETRALYPGPLDHATRVRQLISFIDAQGGPVHLVGNSLGGGLALAVAHQRPDLVRRMVLMGTIGIRFPISPGLEQVWAYTPSVDNMRRLIDLFVYDKTLITDELVQRRFQASAVPSAHDRYAASFPSPRQRYLDEAALDEAALATIDHPVLLIHGREDRVIPWRETSGRLVELLPDAEFHLFPRCGHWTQIERDRDFEWSVGRFLSL